MPKLPYAPDDLGSLFDPEVKELSAGTVLYRVYRRGGTHPTRWSSFRTFGPLPGARFDPHPGVPSGTRDPEPAECAPTGVLYAACGPPEGAEGAVTALAEAFQVTRRLDARAGEPWLCAFALEEYLELLDLRGRWPTRAGASGNIGSGPKNRARSWARAVYDEYVRLDGLYYTSSMDPPQPAVALFERAGRALPPRPLLNTPLSNPGLRARLQHAAHALGYALGP